MKKNDENKLDIGPQANDSKKFTRIMRYHQSWYRSNVLKTPYGIGPKPSDTRFLGSMLSEDAAEVGLNFLTPEIYMLAKQREEESRNGDEKIEPFRLYRNMLSSQPMCFNLFGYVGFDLNMATSLLESILPNEVRNVTKVIVEYSPKPREEYLNDKTAFDAFIEYENVDGEPCFIGIETKLTEPFSQKTPPPDKPEYRRWMKLPTAPWTAEAYNKVADKKHNQLWRDHLLAIALQNHSQSPYKKGRLMLVRHPNDADCRRIAINYQSLLKNGDDSFIDMPLNKLWDYISTLPLNDDQKLWHERFAERYLELAKSTQSENPQSY